MKSHTNAGGLGVNWLSFGSSGHEIKPEGGVLESYTRCAEKNFGANHMIKTICDPIKIQDWGFSVHHPEYHNGFYNLDENGEVIEGQKSKTREVNFEKIIIHHYFTKSKEEFIQKLQRGKADKNDFRSMNEFYSRDRNECENTEILLHV